MTTSTLSSAESFRQELLPGLSTAREAARTLASAAAQQSGPLLLALADNTLAASRDILAANAKDLARMDPGNPKYDRLLLDEQRLAMIADDLRKVAALPCPLRETLEQRTLDNGLELIKRRVPMGVIAVIYESRPNVTFDVFALCLRSGNACVLKGSRDAHDSNLAIVELIHRTLEDFGLPRASVFLTPPQREYLPALLEATEYVDLAIPRGSKGLIDLVRDHARVPVIETGAGIVHTYVDASADLTTARNIITNAKARRVSVCNALDTLLLHESLLPELANLLSVLGNKYQAQVFADPQAYRVLEGNYAGNLQLAEAEHFGQEFLAMKLSVKTVASIEEAMQHIYQYSSRHSEAIVAEDPETLEKFLNGVDAAAVYTNASTAFTDGGQFGMGAEIGISTQKLHARGPMALPELTSYRWEVRGNGQVRD